HWIFFVNLPIGVLTAVFALRLVEPETGMGGRAGADVLGALSITAALMLGVYAIVGPAASDGWSAPATLWCGLGAVLLLAVFIGRELSAARPLVPLGIFRSRNV